MADDDDNDEPQDSWGLLVPYLDDSQSYSYGVEFGQWWQEVQSLEPGDEHTQYIRTENEEQMRLACSRMGWEVVMLEPWTEGPPDNGWILLTVRKT